MLKANRTLLWKKEEVGGEGDEKRILNRKSDLKRTRKTLTSNAGGEGDEGNDGDGGGLGQMLPNYPAKKKNRRQQLQRRGDKVEEVRVLSQRCLTQNVLKFAKYIIDVILLNQYWIEYVIFMNVTLSQSNAHFD